MTCIVPLCRNSRVYPRELKFFRIPKNKKAKFSKIIFYRDDAIAYYKEPRICETHFEKQYIFENGLHFHAVPTLRLPNKPIFSNRHLEFLKTGKKRKSSKKNVQPPSKFELIETIHTTTSNQPVPVYLNDHNSEDPNDDCAVYEDVNCADDYNDDCGNEDEGFRQEDDNYEDDNCDNEDDNDNSCSETDDKETINILLSLFEKEVEKNKKLADENIKLGMELERRKHV